MKICELKTKSGFKIDGPVLLEPTKFFDNRGFFMESWNQQKFEQIVGEDVIFVQDNHSQSTKNVIRGLHYQLNPIPQAKLVRCINGRVFDVAVDVRKDSDTFGQYVGVFLDSVDDYSFWIPNGFAHGFITLSNKADLLYKTTNYWNKDLEVTINCFDSQLDIDWPQPKEVCIFSEKDKYASFLNELSNDKLFL